MVGNFKIMFLEEKIWCILLGKSCLFFIIVFRRCWRGKLEDGERNGYIVFRIIFLCKVRKIRGDLEEFSGCVLGDDGEERGNYRFY